MRGSRGWRAGRACRSMMRTRTPRRASWFASISPVGPAPTTRTSVSICRAPLLRLGRPLELLEEALDRRPLRADIVVSRLHEARCVDRMKQEEAERSEEHTSELQSQSNLVCRLLLEKKQTHDTYVP